MRQQLMALLVMLAFAPATGFATSHDWPGTTSPDVRHTTVKDLKLSHSEIPSPTPAASCREQIRKVICLLEKDGEACIPGGLDYADTFEQLYDTYPPAFQKMFCSLKVIKILKQFEGTAYAGYVFDADHHPIGAQIAIRQSVLDEKLNLEQWASWKEQLSFGGVTDSYTVAKNLPAIETRTATPRVNDFLYFVIAHEFGHLFDFANDLNRTVECPEHQEECAAADGSWTALSWKTNRTPKPANQFPFRKNLCFYWCGGDAMTSMGVRDVYQGLWRSTFLSTYGATNIYDDFADSIAYYLMSTQLRTDYRLNTRQGIRYDTMTKLFSKLFEPKRQYLEAFLASDTIKYP